MENTLANFDENSKMIIKELVKDNEKLVTLIQKLQSAREKINNEVELMHALTEQIKK